MLNFQISSVINEQQKKQQVKKGLKTFFEYKIFLIEKKMRKLNLRTFLNVILSILFLTISFLMRGTNIETLLFKVLIEGITIGGWVFMWESISALFFRKVEFHKKILEYKRLNNAEIAFDRPDSTLAY